MAGVNDYTLDVILKAKSEGLAAFGEMNAKLAELVVAAKLANDILRDMQDQARKTADSLRDLHSESQLMNLQLSSLRDHARDSSLRLRELGQTLADIRDHMRRTEEESRTTNDRLSDMEGILRKTGQATASLADDLVAKLTPALNNTNKAANGATGGGNSGLMGFLNAIIPGGQTAAAMTLIITGLAAAFAPFTAELAASLVLLGAWVVGATAFVGVIGIAVGGIALLAGGLAILGIAAAGGLDPMANLDKANKALATAANQNSAAQETLALAQARVAGSAHPSASALLSLKFAQEQANESAQNLAKAQQAVNVAQTQAAGPVSVLHEKIVAMGQAFGQQALPFVNQTAAAMIGLLPKIQATGQSLIDWFGPRFPTILKTSLQAIDNLIAGLDRIGEAWGKVIDHVLARSPEFGNIINGAFNRVIDGVVGLLDNLVKLSDWFVQRLPTLGKNANDTLANLGIVVQAVGKGLGNFVDWIILHWPEINRVFNAAWDAFKTGWLLIQPFLGQFQTYMTELLPLIKYIGDNLGILKIIMEGMGAVVLILVAALFTLFAIGVLVVAGMVGLGLVLKDLVVRAEGVVKIVTMMAKEAWPALSAAGGALKDAIGTLLGTFASLFDSHEKTVTSSGHVQKAVHDTRDSFTQFMTSSGVIGILAFLSVQLPADILVAASWLKVLADRVALNMVLIGTTIKVTADIARGDWAQAGADMVRGQEAASALMKKDSTDTSAAMILTDKLMNGTIEAQTESFKQAMITKFTDMNTGTTTQVGNMKDQHLHHIQELNDRIVGKSIIPDMVNSVTTWFNTMSDSTTRTVNTMVGAIARSFGTLSGSLNSTLTEAIRIIDLFIQAVDKLPGVNIPQIHMAQGGVVNPNAGPPGLRPLAQGGTLPGYAPGQDSVLAMLSPGEGVLTPQAVRGLGGAAVIDTINKVAPHFAAGGVVGNPYPAGQCTWGVYSMFPGMPVDGNAKDWMGLPLAKAGGPAPGEVVVYGTSYSPFGHVARVDSGLNAAGQFAVTEMNYKGVGIWDQRMSSLAGVLGFLQPGVPGAPGGASGSPIGGIDIFGPIVDAASGIAKSALNAIPQWIRGLPDAVVDQMANGVKAMASNFTGAGTPSGAPTVGGNLGQWILSAIAATGVPTSWSGPLGVLISRESGGNPNAINRTDINALLGHPSQGLAQVIPGTFAAYHQAGTSGNILDPVANIAAAINYIKARYGTIFNVQQANAALPPKGYDRGGQLPPGPSLVYNGTGRSENVTPGDTMDKVIAVLQSIDTRLATLSGQPRLSGQLATQRNG